MPRALCPKVRRERVHREERRDLYPRFVGAGALNGITRNTIFAIAKDFGIEVVQKRITRDEVYIADEAFFTGTAAEVTPIRELIASKSLR